MGSKVCESVEVENFPRLCSRKSSYFRISFSKKFVLLITCGILFLGLPCHLKAHGTAEENSVTHSQREDLFSSTSKLEELVENELQIVDLLDTFAEYALERAQTIKTYVESQKRLLMNGKTSKDIVAHPVEAYLLVRRLTADWEDVHIALHGISNFSQGVFTWTEQYRDGNNFPRLEDLNGAAQAIVRLQDTYKLKMNAFSTGSIKIPEDMQTSEKELVGTHGLSARDMLFLGKHAFTQGLYNRAIEWLRGAQDSASKESNASSILEEIAPSLRSAIEVHDDILERQGPSGVAWKTNPVPIDPELAKNIKYRASHKDQFVPKLFQRQTEDEETDHYIRLCRGEKLRSPEFETSLRCRLKFTGSPYLKISPLKIEEASHDPHVVIIHDFITPAQADFLIGLGKPKLFRSRHRHHKDGKMDIVSQKRVSQNAWIKDWEDPIMNKLTQRVQLVTGLKAAQPKEAEDYQIANYGLGGLYVPHTDHLMTNPNPDAYSPWEKFVGDRIATLMIYLSEVRGGATVFPRSAITLWPRKGSAAFWWNLDRSGTGDENTRHGACPVLYGDKWVSNKWIRFNEQFQTAQCGLHSLDKYQRP